MSNILTDGTGKGYTARVNYKNRLSTTTETLDNIFVKSLSGEAFSIGTPVFAVSSNTTGVLWYYNFTEPSKKFAIQSLQFFWNGGDATNTKTVKFVQKIIAVEPTLYTTSNLVQNMNFGSTETIDLVSYRWNETDGYNMGGGVSIDSAEYIMAPGSTELVYNGAFILDKDTKIGYGIETDVDGECAMFMTGFLVDVDLDL